MLSVREGDTDKLGVLFERYHKNLYAFFLFQTRNVHVSEDLVQEVFFRMLKYCHTYRDKSEFRTWMFAIARNARIDHYKKHAIENGHTVITESIESSDPAPDIVMERENDRAVLKKALYMLSHDKRELIIMARFNNLRYHEIAALLGCSEGALKVRMYRAMKELTEIYKRLTGGNCHEMRKNQDIVS